MTDDIPDEVRGFIFHYIDSVAKIEALLLMRSQPEQEWDASLLARRLYIDPGETARILTDLSTAGFCAPTPGKNGFYCFWPATPEIRNRIEQVAEVYARRLIPVTHLIHQRAAQPSNRSLQMFADAFKLTKDPNKEK